MTKPANNSGAPRRGIACYARRQDVIAPGLTSAALKRLRGAPLKA